MHWYNAACLVLSAVWTELATSLDCFQYFSIYWRLNSFVQSCLRCEHVCKQVSVANWKLGWGKTKLCLHCISRLDKTVSKLSVTYSLDLLPVLFTLPTWTRQDILVLPMSVVWTRHYGMLCTGFYTLAVTWRATQAVQVPVAKWWLVIYRVWDTCWMTVLSSSLHPVLVTTHCKLLVMHSSYFCSFLPNCRYLYQQFGQFELRV